MTGTREPGDATADADGLLRNVLGALLREDVAGLRTRAKPVEAPDGTWLRVPARHGDALLLPVEQDGFQGEFRARMPLLRRASDGTDLTTVDSVLAALSDQADPADRAGFAAFGEECRQAAATLRLHRATQDTVTARLAERYGDDPADWTGPDASLAFDTLAARLDHPVHPTGRARTGITERQLRAYAPEFHPRFRLRWLALPRESLTGRGPVPDAWPSPSALGLPAPLDGTHVTLPVHPLTVGPRLRDLLRHQGLDGRAVLAERAYAEVVPTLSMRTVALVGTPGTHLKLPLMTSTLGRLNLRTVKPGTLYDGAACQRLLTAVLAREERFRDTVLLADETSFAHADHELLSVLRRRYPRGLDGTVTVPMAALLSPAPDERPGQREGPGRQERSARSGRLVIDRLADRFYRGDPLALLDAVLTLLFDWQTTLFGYGIALESHQQNISLVLDDRPGRPPLRLLFKDNDGPRINTARLGDRLGPEPPGLADFDDARILCADDGPVADLFTTITVHLCAGAYAFGLARRGHAPLDRLLALIRDRLGAAVERLGTRPGQPGAVLRTRVLDAERLPVKAMVTAGTLLTKERSGASDINKHYTTGPNYLLRGA
ncbi:IucA/IucC family protein [Streptomyces sp. NPDC058001]|uniref:IucA/IucC family protein n=1 Tax=Streptomyces sp. NPDC058001 TaxID=3346300 RepID=UPI0036E69E27